MLTALKIVLPLLLIWIALCLVCALRVTRRRRTGASQVAGDPYLHPFGEMPGFTAEQLRRLAPVPRNDDPLRRPHLRNHSQSAGALQAEDAGSVRSMPTIPDAARIDPVEVFEGCWRRPRG